MMFDAGFITAGHIQRVESPACYRQKGAEVANLVAEYDGRRLVVLCPSGGTLYVQKDATSQQLEVIEKMAVEMTKGHDCAIPSFRRVRGLDSVVGCMIDYRSSAKEDHNP